MNWDHVQGQWNQLKGEIRSKWGKLTDDDVKHVAGKKDKLIGKLQERYGVMKDDAERQVDEWIDKIGEKSPKDGPRH